jgi:hypothetical protein
MLLIPDPLRERLVANFRAGPEHDPAPVVKLYAPWGVAVWLLTELMEDGDTFFGLCDLGFGCPELGYVSWAELEALRGPLGLGIRRDERFAPARPLSVYAGAARLWGRIVEDEALLADAARHMSPLPLDPGG